MQVAECFLSGAVTFRDVAAMLDVDQRTISAVLRDPLPCAWIARMIREHVKQRMGLVDAAVLGRALGGSVEAAKLVYQRFDGLAPDGAVNINIGGSGIDYAKLSDEDLDRLVVHRSKRIIDVKAAEEDEPEEEHVKESD
jgi:hypothetical protein